MITKEQSTKDHELDKTGTPIVMYMKCKGKWLPCTEWSEIQKSK